MRINLNWKSALMLICIAYTLLTIISSSYALLSGTTTETHFHLLARFVVTAIGVGSILMFNLLPRWPLWAMFAIHYAATMGIIFGLVWVSGYFVELHPDAYRDIFLNFTPIYVLIAAGFLISTKYRK
jgi:hypothetical protein